MASRFGNRVQTGRRLMDEELGGGLELPEALIEDTVLADLIRDRMRISRDYDGVTSFREQTGIDAEGNPVYTGVHGIDGTLGNLYLGNGGVNKMAKDEVEIPEDPEVDHIVDEADLSDLSHISGGRHKAPKVKDPLDIKIEDSNKAAKKAARRKQREQQLRSIAVDMLMKQGNALTNEQEALVGEDPENPVEALGDIVQWDTRVDKDIHKDQFERDKNLKRKDKLARKVIAYFDDPKGFQKSWYVENPVYASRKLPDGTTEKKEIIYSEDNPDPDLEGVDLVKYADAMNEKFTRNKPGFIEYDFGDNVTRTGDTAYPEDLLAAAAEGKEYSEPPKLEFPELAKSDIDPKQNRLGMVRRMLFGELDDAELAYLMKLIGKDQQFAKGGFVDGSALRKLQKIYGPNHPVLSDKRFKVQYVGRKAMNIRRVI